MKSISMTVFLIVAFTLLAIDSFGSYNTSIRYFNIDSRFVLIIFLITNIVLAFFNRYPIQKAILPLNKLIFIFLFSLLLIFIIANRLTDKTFVFSILNIRVENFIFLPLLYGSIMYVYHSAKQSLKQKLVFLMPPLVLILLIFIDILNRDLFIRLAYEDGIFEWIQLIFYLISASIFFSILRRLDIKKDLLKYILCLLLTLGLIFVAGEEISWGSRIFTFELPKEITQNNLQEELNIHNNKSIALFIPLLYIMIGLWGSLCYIVLSRFAHGILQRFQILVPQPLLFLYFFSVFALYFFNGYIGYYYELFTFKISGMLKWQEVAELFLSAGFLLFAIFSRKLNKF